VANGILDERLQQETGHHHAEQIIVCAHADLEASFEARQFNRDEVVEERELLAECHDRLGGVAERRAQQIAQLRHQPSRHLRVRFGQRADRVERVEEEVRMQLRAQALQL
jgi:hypothetical protein